MRKTYIAAYKKEILQRFQYRNASQKHNKNGFVSRPCLSKLGSPEDYKAHAQNTVDGHTSGNSTLLKHQLYYLSFGKDCEGNPATLASLALSLMQ